MKIGKYLITKDYPREFERYAIKGRDLIGVEIGVYKGEHAIMMLDNLSIEHLYLIDPYETYNEVTHKEVYSKAKIEEAREIAINKIAEDGDKITWIFEESAKALKKVPENVDFVYIDGKHDYESVKEDIENYYPKIKKGGIIGGDNFYNGYGSAIKANSGTITAVIEFAVKNELQLYSQGRDWWMYKNE